MPTWERNIVKTNLDWREGKRYWAKPAQPGESKRLHIYQGKPRVKGSGRFHGEVRVEVDTSAYLYTCMKTEKGKINIKRSLRAGKRAPRKTTSQASKKRTTTTKKSTPKGRSSSTRSPRSSKKKTTSRSSSSERQTMFPWAWWLR